MPRKKQKTQTPQTQPPLFKIYETYNRIDPWLIDHLVSTKPTCFNGDIRIKRYRITIEEIQEPNVILGQRLQKLWEECDNWHHHDNLITTAKEIGWVLQGDRGQKRKQNG